MKISIGTLSKAFDLSDEALRFYEKRGLLHPQREDGSGYRVYEQADIQRVANIKRLKSQGFTLDEIQRVYSHSGEDELDAIYREKILAAQREIAHRTQVLAHMIEARRTLAEAPSLLLKPEERAIGKVYLLEYASIPAMWDRLADEPLLKKLFRQLPLTAYTTLVGREALAGATPRLRKGVLLLERDVQVLGVDTSALRLIDASRAVCCLFRLENGVFDVDALGRVLNGYLTEHCLTASDDLFTLQLLSYVNAGGQAIHYARMVAPIR